MSPWTQAAAQTGASSARAPAHRVAQPIASVTHRIVQSRILLLARAASGSGSPAALASSAPAPVTTTAVVTRRRREASATAAAVARVEALVFWPCN